LENTDECSEVLIIVLPYIGIMQTKRLNLLYLHPMEDISFCRSYWRVGTPSVWPCAVNGKTYKVWAHETYV